MILHAKKTLLKRLIPLIILLSIFLYYNRSAYIDKYCWKYNGGYHLRGWIEFNKNQSIKLKGRKIFISDKKVGSIFLCAGKYLIINSNNGDFAIYVNKGKIK